MVELEGETGWGGEGSTSKIIMFLEENFGKKGGKDVGTELPERGVEEVVRHLKGRVGEEEGNGNLENT